VEGKRGFLGRVFRWFLGLLVPLLVGVVAIPFLVDVDKYRPQIVDLANSYINGKLELGKLKLSLWGQIRVEVDGFRLSDSGGRKIVSAKDVFFHVPFLPILSGAPVVTFKMARPELTVVKNRAGKLNVLSLVKESAVAPGAVPAPAKGGVKGGAGTQLSSLATKARLGIEMKQAAMAYKDEATALISEVKDLNLSVRDISLTRPMIVEVGAQLDTRMGKTLMLKGPATIAGTIAPKFDNTDFKSARILLKADLDAVGIDAAGAFVKKPGIPTRAELACSVTPAELKLDRLVATFHNAILTVTGQLDLAKAELKIDAQSNEIALKPWAELIPALAAYELGGTAKLDAGASGGFVTPAYRAQLDVKGMTAKAPGLKAQPLIAVQVKVVTDRIESMVMTMRAPGNELKVAGTVTSFTKPQVVLQVSSPGMDLDQLIDFPKPAKAATAAKGSGESAPAAGGKAVPPADLDASLDPLRKNDVLAGMGLSVRTQIKFMKAQGVRLDDITGNLTLRDLNLGFEQAGFSVFGGHITAGMAAALKPATPTYRYSFGVERLDLQQAVASQFEFFKNTVLGKASFKMEGTGASFNAEPAKMNLNARGNMRVDQPTFASIDVGRMATEAINKAIENASGKIPQVKGKTVKPPAAGATKYQYLSGDFTIMGGKFSAPNFVAVPEPKAGIDVKGDTLVNLKDSTLKARWELVDTYNVTKARDINVEANGVRVEHIFAEGDGPVHFPVELSGPLASPTTNYGGVPEALAKVALANVTRALEGRLKAEAQQRLEAEARKIVPKPVQEAIQKAAPKPVQDALQGFGKKLFGK